MKLIFAGTPPFAAIALDALIAAGHEIGLVLTQPDRPAGRGMQVQASAVKRTALAHGLQVLQPASLKDASAVDPVRRVAAEAMIVAAYGLILPATVLTIPARGCLNIHASLLPRWRGAAPIQRAILAGDAQTGITIMQMDEGLDTGAILLQEPVAIEANETAQTLHDKLATLGARAVVRALEESASPRTQDSASATYAAKIAKSEAVIDWSRSATEICRQIRAFNPVPGAGTTINGVGIKVWMAQPIAHATASPGTILSAAATGIVIAAGQDAVQISELQKSGGKRLSADVFLKGFSLKSGLSAGT